MQVLSTKGLQQVAEAPAPDESVAAYIITENELGKLPMFGHCFAEAPPVAQGGTRFESHRRFDYVSLNIPNAQDVDAEPLHVSIYFAGSWLVFVCDALPGLERLEADMKNAAEEKGTVPPERVLYLFFAHLLSGDPQLLSDIEEEISGIEDRIIADDTDENYVGEISALRKRLLALKRYYEATFDLLQDLEENQNGFLSKGQLHYFRIQTNRADRLSRTVLNLRDYVTQVRESYQNQLDIGLNKVMKVFTVITAIFLPLTLIAGWYGMNVDMPELAWPYLYPAIIGVCVVIVVGCLWYFKRHKWF